MAPGQIHTWFPKSIYMVDELLVDQFPTYETRIKELLSNVDSWRTDMLNVDSTWDRNEKLHEDPVFKDLVEAINAHARIFIKELGFNDSFANNLRITNMWGNVSGDGDFLFPHVHTHSILSGAFYIKKCPDSKIKFFNDLGDMFPEPHVTNPLNYKFCEYPCDPGRLIMFKSDLLHGTGKQSNGEKIVISFNISDNN
jgi:uncharacterized protein (TIGR02466 family)